MLHRSFTLAAFLALVSLSACSDGEDLPVECRTSADCAVGNCLETLCTTGGVGGPSVFAPSQGAPGESDAGQVDAADAGVPTDTTPMPDVEVVTCFDLVFSEEPVTVSTSGTTIRVGNSGTAGLIVSIISVSPVSVFRLTAPSNSQLPVVIDGASSLSVQVSAAPGEPGSGVLDIVTSACTISIPLVAP